MNSKNAERSSEQSEPDAKQLAPNTDRLAQDTKKLVQDASRLAKSANQLAQAAEQLVQDAEQSTQITKQKDGCNWLNHVLAVLSVVLSMASLMAVVFGAVVLYSHLKNLDQLSLFAQVIFNPGVLVSIWVAFLVLLVLFFGPFYILYLLAYTVKNAVKKDAEEVYGFLLLWGAVVVVVAMLATAFAVACAHTALSPAVIFIGMCIAFFWICRCSLKKFDLPSTRYLSDVFLIFGVCGLVYYFWLCVVLLLGLRFVVYPINSIDSISVIVIIVLLFICFIFSIICGSQMVFSTKKLDQILFLVSLTILFFIILILFASPQGQRVNAYLLNQLGYIEQETEARWYLLDQRFVDQAFVQEKPDEQSATYAELGGKFSCNCGKCKSIIKGSGAEACKIDKNVRDQYKNVLYGYMRWNLGDTKIFCPANVQLSFSSEDKKNIQQCLKIKGEYLHPWPEFKLKPE